jgi:hypothetical protein
LSTHAHPATLPRGRPALAAAGRFLRTERGVVWTALGAIALHIADDNYFQPAPGTGPRDHVASGLVPLAFLALAGWSYPHLRAGLRAGLAMTVGALGIAFGIPSAYYFSHGAAQGDHWTGVLSIAAGAVLVASGPVTLWLNRSHAPDRKHRYRHRALTGAAIVVLTPVLLAAIVFPVGFPYIYTHSGRIVENANLGVPYETVHFRTSDSLELTGYYVPSKNRAAVVLYPGQSRSDEARMLLRHGYGVLLVDARGQGRSEGDVGRWMGYRDIIAGATYLQSRPDVDPARVAGYGFSIGGEQLLEAAARSTAIAAVVSEGAGSRVGSEPDLHGVAKVLFAPTLAVMTASMTVFQNDGPPAPIQDRIGLIAPRPVLLMYADPGMGGESTLQDDFYAAAGEPKQIWKVPGSQHTGGLDAQPRAYEQRVTTFLDQALLDR